MTTLNLQVAASSDDAHEFHNNSYNDSDTLVQANSASGASTRTNAGTRFLNLTGIASEDTINSATWQVYVDSTTYDDANWFIHAHDVDNSPTFSSGNGPYDRQGGGALTSNWDFWISTGVGTGWKSRTLTSAVQEVVDRAGWSSGNALSIITAGQSSTALMRFRSYDYSGNAHGAKLDIDFTGSSVDGTATPSAVAATTSIPSATVTASSTASPSAVAATASAPQASATAASTAAPDLVAVTTSLPAATVTADSTADAELVVTAAALPSATVTAGSTADAEVVATSAVLPAATPTASSTAAAELVVTTATSPAATATAASTASPATFTLTVTAPAVTASGNVTTTTRTTVAGTYQLVEDLPQIRVVRATVTVDLRFAWAAFFEILARHAARLAFLRAQQTWMRTGRAADLELGGDAYQITTSVGSTAGLAVAERVRTQTILDMDDRRSQDDDDLIRILNALAQG